MKKVFVAGNGPSLTELDFNKLTRIDWLGMNAAYRYWDEIGIYPTFYCCLDKVVIRDHAVEIERLIRDKKVKNAFLIKEILDIFPELSEEPNVVFLEDLIAREGKEYDIFKTKYSSKKTTGSWAIRYLIFCGYTDIFLCGIDCNYVELVEGSNSTGTDLQLRIDRDTDNNPNYFFQGYQRRGDLYQIPNPESHFGNLHLQSLEALAIDVNENFPAVSIYNTAKRSNLYRYDVFPFRTLADVFSSPVLEAVVIPLISSDVEALLCNLRIWSYVGFQPISVSSKYFGEVYLHLIFDENQDEKVVESIVSLFNSSHYLKRCFVSLRITYLNIPEEINKYIRDPKDKSSYRKSGPNTHFLAAMEICTVYKYILYIEADAVPVRQGWFTVLNDFTSNNQNLLVGGALVDDMDGIDPAYTLHLNGNAIYASGTDEFRSFLEDIFLPILQYLVVDLGKKDIAYDCVISYFLSLVMTQSFRIDTSLPSEPLVKELYRKLIKILPDFRVCSLIKNIPPSVEAVDLADRYVLSSTDTAIVHSKTLSDLLHYKLKLVESARYNVSDADELIKSRFIDSHFSPPLLGQLPSFYCDVNRRGLKLRYIDHSKQVLCLDGSDVSEAALDDNSKGACLYFDTRKLEEGEEVNLELDIFSSDDLAICVSISHHPVSTNENNTKSLLIAGRVPIKARLALVAGQKNENICLKLVPRSSFSSLEINYSMNISKGPQDLEEGVVLEAKKKAIVERFKQQQSLSDRRITKFNEPLSVEYRIPKFQSSLPKTLVIDATLLGSDTATGQIKSFFFNSWPVDSVYQIFVQSGRLAGAYPKISARWEYFESTIDLINAVKEFSPQLIYFRPTDNIELFKIVVQVGHELSIPLITHMMDDWPTSINENRDLFNLNLRTVFRNATLNLTICKEMTDIYRERYGTDFTSIANGVDTDRFLPKDWQKRSPISAKSPIVIKYMGGVADNMNFSSVIRFARVVSKLSKAYPITFQIFTMPWYLNKVKNHTSDLPSVKVNPLVEREFYYKNLVESDGLLIPYNFDQDSLNYVGLSLANKLPESLAAGVPIITIGHHSIPTVKYMEETVNETVFSSDVTLEIELEERITEIYFKREKSYLYGITKKTRKAAEDEFESEQIQSRFREMLIDTSRTLSTNFVSCTDRRHMLSEANTYFNERNFVEAKKLYELLKLDETRLSKFYDLWIDLCNDRESA